MQGLVDFLPIRNIRTLVPQIRTLEGELLRQPAHYQYTCTEFMHAHVCTACVCMLREHRATHSKVLVLAVQVATWVKRNFALRPALNRIRKERGDHRQTQSDQVDRMY